MLNLALVFSFTLVTAPPAVTATPPSVLRRAPPSTEAGRTYHELRSVGPGERVRLFDEMPSALKSAVVAHHLLTALAGHPEFTREQREVIQEALSLVTPLLYEIRPSSPHWGELVDQRLRQFKRRAKAAFDTKTARELFTQLGPSEPAGPPPDLQGITVWPMTAPGIAPNRLTTLGSVFPVCECSVISDWCSDWSGLGIVSCQNMASNCWFRNSGCGTFLQYACNGMCRRRPG